MRQNKPLPTRSACERVSEPNRTTSYAGKGFDSWRRLADDYLLYRQATRDTKTAEKSRYLLQRFLEWNPPAPSQFRREDWLRFLLYLREETGYSEWTIHTAAREVSQFLRWLEQEGLLAPIVRQGDLPKPPAPNPKPLGRGELQNLLKVAGSSRGWLARRDVAIIACLADTGLRRGELLQMSVEHALAGAGVVKQKGGSWRRFALASETQALIRQYLRACEKSGFALEPNAPLWRARDGSPLTASGLREIFRRLSRKLGQRIYPHALRATSATLRLAQGVPTEVIRRGLGHRDPRAIQHYVRVAESDADRLLRESNPLRLLSRKGK